METLQKQIEEARKRLDDLVSHGADRERILEESRKVDELIARYYKST